MRIRGTFFKDYTKIVLDSPDLDWDRYLAREDWQVVRQTIIPTEWYPAEIMGRIGRGIFEMRTQNKYELVRMHGRARATDSFDEATKKFLLKNDPASSLRAYAQIAGRFIDELKVKLEKAEPGRAEISFFPVDGVPSWDLFREIQAGTLEKLIELNGGKNPEATFRSESRDQREACIVNLAWEKG